ncbi:LysM domain-containing protein [Heracleum sosnowskyi]|uniref:LysM domain-containing protein n=1 Tax=Heracleum sosnowskyi TaxID=360622 RepID=A0AAD8MKQ4_9APIA|nr:LysM domain-containing protein [Heracleum sosnowskyi]
MEPTRQLHALEVGGDQLMPIGRICDQIFVVGEGETLHTINDKCKEPFITEQNPNIQDSDDVFPGLVIKITSRICSLAASSFIVKVLQIYSSVITYVHACTESFIYLFLFFGVNLS